MFHGYFAGAASPKLVLTIPMDTFSVWLNFQSSGQVDGTIDYKDHPMGVHWTTLPTWGRPLDSTWLVLVQSLFLFERK